MNLNLKDARKLSSKTDEERLKYKTNNSQSFYFRIN